MHSEFPSWSMFSFVTAGLVFCGTTIPLLQKQFRLFRLPGYLAYFYLVSLLILLGWLSRFSALILLLSGPGVIVPGLCWKFASRGRDGGTEEAAPDPNES